MQGNSGDGDNPASTGDDPDALHAQRISHYEHAAREAVVAHPMPGEDLATTYLDDAQMWLGVYTELLQFKETLLRDTERALETLQAPGRRDVQKTDAVILGAEAQRFRKRLALWQERCRELTPGPSTPEVPQGGGP